MFSREADDAIQAIVSAIEDMEAAGMTATGVTEDRVTVDDIAERAGVTVTAVRYWISGLAVDARAPRHSMMFEAGVGAQTAQFQWYCSWARAALSDDGLQDAALAQLARFPTLSVWQHMDEVGHTLFVRIHNEAVLGKLDELAGYVADNCNSDAAAAK